MQLLRFYVSPQQIKILGNYDRSKEPSTSPITYLAFCLPDSGNTQLIIRWEEYHTGTLYLSAFSGPVEGILMIVAIYTITALNPLGQKFWSKPILGLIPGEYATAFAGQLDKALGLRGWLSGRGWNGLEELPINVAFMVFGACGTVGNIVNRYVPDLANFLTILDCTADNRLNVADEV